jgi:hypothetical protein
MDLISPRLACWLLLESGPPRLTTVPNTLTAAVLALAMMELTPIPMSPLALAVALASLEMPRHSATNTKLSCDNIGKPK